MYNVGYLDLDIKDYWDTFPYEEFLREAKPENTTEVIELYIVILFTIKNNINLQKELILDEKIKLMEILRDSCKFLLPDHVNILVILINLLEDKILCEECEKEVLNHFGYLR